MRAETLVEPADPFDDDAAKYRHDEHRTLIAQNLDESGAGTIVGTGAPAAVVRRRRAFDRVARDDGHLGMRVEHAHLLGENVGAHPSSLSSSANTDRCGSQPGVSRRGEARFA